MKLDEFIVLAKSIKTCYPNSKLLETKESIEIWYSLLSDLEYETASLAVKKYMMLNKFPPTIADIREGYADIAYGKPMSGSNAWSIILDTLRSIEVEGCAKQKYDGLPELIRDAIGGYSQFREWAENHKFNRDMAMVNFLKCYNKTVEHDTEVKKLHVDILKMIDSRPNKMITQNETLEIEENKGAKDNQDWKNNPYIKQWDRFDWGSDNV